MTPRASIVINNFNYARFLPQSIESALAQTYPETEVIVVDDCSTDGSRDIIRSYGDRLVPVLQENNGGQAAAMNAGFAASRGDLVIFLDADDYLYPNAAEMVAAALGRGVGTIQYRLHLVDGAGSRIDLYPPPEVAFDSGNVVPKLLATGRYQGTVTSGNAFSRATLSAILPIPAERFRISADGYLVTSAPFHGSVASIDAPLGAYRMHGGNLWLKGPSMVKRFQRSILHDFDKHQVLRERAAAASLAATAQPGLNDYQHLEMRLGSLCLEPTEHPIPSDTRPGLALHGVRAVFWAPLPLRRRALLATWFLLVGLLPRRLAGEVLAWRLESSSRPKPVQVVLKQLRRLTR
jgi:hypothetical protein